MGNKLYKNRPYSFSLLTGLSIGATKPNYYFMSA
jgi:hypothetical protein